MEKIGLVAIFDVTQFNEGLDTYTQGLSQANDATGQAEKDGFSFTRSLEVFVGNALVKIGELAIDAAAKLFELGKESVTLASDFESKMTILQTAAADSGKSVEELGEIMIAVGGDSRILGASATGAADAATNLFKAGLKTEAVMSNLNGFMEDGEKLTGALASSFDLAAATGLDVGRASEIAAINLSTFGGELKTGAEQADFIQFSLDNLVKAADASVAEVADLAEAMAVVGPSANAAGMNFQDTTNALAIFSTAGITGSRAGTTLEATLRDLRKTTPKATEMLDQLGISLYDQQGAMLPLVDIVGQFEQATADMTQEQRDQSLQAIFQAQGMRGIQVLLEKGVGGWNDMADAVEGATGIQEQAELRSKTFAGQMESLDGQIETLKIRFGQALLPALGSVVGVFSKLIDKHGPALENMFKTVGDTVGGVFSFIAGVIDTKGDLMNDSFLELPEPLQEFVRFLVGTFIPKVEEVWGTIQSNINSFVTWFQNNVTPIIIESAEKITSWFNNTFLPKLETIWEDVQKAIQVFVGWYEENLPALEETAKKIIDWFKGTLIPTVTTVWETIQEKIGMVLDWYNENAPTLEETAQKIVDFFENVLKPTIEEVWSFIQEQIQNVVAWYEENLPRFEETAQKIVDFFQGPFKAGVDEAWAFVQEIVGFVVAWFDENMPEIESAVKKIVDFFKNIFKPSVQRDNQALLDFFNNVFLPIMQDVWELVQSTIRAVLIIITELIEIFIAIINGDWEAFWDSIMTIAATILAWLIDRTGEVLEILASLFGAMIAKLIENWEDAWNQIKLTFELTWAAIVKFMESIGPAMKKLWEGIIEVITTPWEELGPKILGLIQGAVTSIQTWFTNNAHLFVRMGKDIVAGMLKGVQDDIGGLVTFLSGIAGDIVGNFKKALGIGSPSKVFAEIGANVIEGLTLGIAANTDAPNKALMGTVGNMMSSVNNVDNSVTNNIEINSTNIPQAPTQIFFDVVSALSAVSG